MLGVAISNSVATHHDLQRQNDCCFAILARLQSSLPFWHGCHHGRCNPIKKNPAELLGIARGLTESPANDKCEVVHQKLSTSWLVTIVPLVTDLRNRENHAKVLAKAKFCHATRAQAVALADRSSQRLGNNIKRLLALRDQSSSPQGKDPQPLGKLQAFPPGRRHECPSNSPRRSALIANSLG